jgi:hypothetical protein
MPKIVCQKSCQNLLNFLGPKNGVVMTFGENGQFFLLKITENMAVSANGQGVKMFNCAYVYLI